MPIEVNVTNQETEVSTSGQTVNATVSGGVGPAGPTGPQGATGATGPAGTTTWSGITDKPTTFAPASHAVSHAAAGGDPLTLAVSQVTGLSGLLSAKASSNSVAGIADRAFSVFDLANDQDAITIDDGFLTIGGAQDLSQWLGALGAASASHTHTASAITGGTIATARLGSGTASASTYLRGDQTWATIASYTLPAATTSTLGGVIVGTGLGVTSGTASVTYGTTAGTACQGNDSRLSDARTPTSHVHAASDITSGTLADSRLSANARQSVESFVHPFLLGGL